MPARVATSTSARSASNMVNSTLRTGGTNAKKTRAVRRRGRAKPGMESDDDIEREVRTDSESEDDLSSSDTSSDSDTEPASEDVLSSDQPQVLIPSTSQSPEGAPKTVHPSFFEGSGSWSEIVADEAAHGSEGLPVIDFTELDSQVLPLPTQSRKSRKNKQHNRLPSTSSATSLPPNSPTPSNELDRSHAPPRSTPRRMAGQTARQAYQHRLESDPSYVPTVGQFWGHDDRLLDKDLRSLSGWWRGRWQGGPRGRGGFSRGTGRGGFLGRSGLGNPSLAQDVEHEGEVQPVDRAWTHDGFEELKRTEERRSGASQRPAHTQVAPRSFDVSRGRGGFLAARGGRGGRGAFSPPFRPHRIPASDPDRVWFVKKPEHMWTKQAESFLYFDHSSKPRGGNLGTVRVKVPNQKTPAVRIPIQSSHSEASTSKLPDPASNTGSDYSDRVLVVKLPKSLPKEEPPVKKSVVEALSVDEPSIEDVFTVRPRLVPTKPIPLPEPTAHKTSSSTASVDPAIQQKLEQVSIEPQKIDPARWIQTEEAVLRNPTGTVPEERQVPEEQPSVSSMQHTFTPPQTSSPAYGSPYQYAPPLPPGVAINPAGMTYEVATGRPVYLPPPSNMYAPVMQPVPFVPGHGHHHSTVSSSDFIQPGTPPIHGGYMEYAPPPPTLFSFPRQSSRIQIRAPDGSPLKSTSKTPPSTSSGDLKSDAVVLESSESQQQVASPAADGRYPPETDDSEQVQEPMMGYVPYNPYYYPEYGYNPYVDMSQVAQYDMYPPPPPQGTVYYH